jgi:hypothetical protein
LVVTRKAVSPRLAISERSSSSATAMLTASNVASRR